ncbi:MAG: hypothetical protein J7L73_08525 [Anaerolineales bacterium]|nr:hypothetical protein [Anaerolineales bacterium]
MDITIPTALKSLSSAGSAIKALVEWNKKAKGDARALISELKDIMTYLDMVSKDEVDLDVVIDKLSISEYKQLSQSGFDFNKLKNSKIRKYPSLEGTELSNWVGKETEDLIESIYDKIKELKIRYSIVGESKNYRWNIRVNNIRKRIWLLLRHIDS